MDNNIPLSISILLNTEMETVTALKENKEIKEPCTPETVDIDRSASKCSDIDNSLEFQRNSLDLCVPVVNKPVDNEKEKRVSDIIKSLEMKHIETKGRISPSLTKKNVKSNKVISSLESGIDTKKEEFFLEKNVMTIVNLPNSNVAKLEELEADSEELNVGQNEKGSNGLMKKQELIEQQKHEIDECIVMVDKIRNEIKESKSPQSKRKGIGNNCVISNLEINLDKDNDNASPNFSSTSTVDHPNDDDEGRLRKIERVTDVNNVHGIEKKSPLLEHKLVDSIGATSCLESELDEKCQEVYPTFSELRLGTNMGNEFSKLENELKEKKELIEKQKQEIDQYIAMVDNYRDTVRKKNTSIRLIEKENIELRNHTISVKSGTGETLIETVNESESFLETQSNVLKAKEETKVSKEFKKPNSLHRSKSDGGALKPSNFSSATDSEIQLLNLKLDAAEKEMQHQKLEISSLNELHKGEVQVVYSLTKENNAYRIKETENMKRIDEIDKESKILRNKMSIDREECKHLEERIITTERNNQSFLEDKRKLEESEKEFQFKLLELENQVIEFEKTSKLYVIEKEAMQKMLEVSRKNESNLISKVETAVDDKESVSTMVVTSKEQEEVSSGIMLKEKKHSEEVEALKLALDVAAKREKELGILLNLQLGKVNSNNITDQVEITENFLNDRDSIIDKLSESQQEAILHLKDKVQDLRSQLNQDHENKTQFEESIKKKDETIKVLRKESELFASELVINENDRENLHRNLAVKVGENCSLKEELSTSEGISEKLQSLQLHLNEKDQKNQELESNEKKLKSIEHTLQEKIKELEKEKDDMSEALDKQKNQSKCNKYKSIVESNKADILGLKESLYRKETAQISLEVEHAEREHALKAMLVEKDRKITILNAKLKKTTENDAWEKVSNSYNSVTAELNAGIEALTDNMFSVGTNPEKVLSDDVDSSGENEGNISDNEEITIFGASSF